MANAAPTPHADFSGTQEMPTEKRAASATILIVDDDAMNRFLMQESLAMDGHRIIEAGSGEEALDIATAQMPDLILLDIEMPGMNGLAACRAIRATPAGKLIPIMMVTGLDNAASVDAAFECGATDFLAKPLNWTLMRQRVRFILRHGSIVQQLSRNEQIFEQVHDIAKIGHWEWDLRTGVMHTSPQMRKMFPQTQPVATGIWLDYKPRSKHAALVVTETKKAVERRQNSFIAEDTVDVPGGGSIRLLSHGQIEYDGDNAVRVIGSLQDVTQRYLDEERFTAIFRTSPVGIVEADYSALYALTMEIASLSSDDEIDRLVKSRIARMAQGVPSPLHILNINPAAKCMLGENALDDNRLHAIGAECELAIINGWRQQRTEVETQFEIPRADGSSRHLIIRQPVPRTADEFQCVVITIVDITDLLQRDESLRRTEKIIENSSDAVAVVGKNKRIESVNPAFLRISGFTLEQLKAQPVKSLTVPSAERPAMDEEVRHDLGMHGRWRGETQLKRHDGALVPVLCNVNVVKDSSGQATGYVMVMTDITHLKESERRLFHLAHYDSLTALPNRLSLQERLQQEFTNAQSNPTSFSLLYIDLDGFKLINDSMGHNIGDILLAEVAKRLKAASRPDDLLARIGGDEFALLMLDTHDRKQIVTQADRLLAALDAPFNMQGREIFIGASIGTCSHPDEASNADEMLRNADTAMYQAKRLGRGQLCFYSNALTTESSRRLGIENELRTGIASGQLFLVYQPKYDAATSTQMVGAEALVRWQSPTRGVVPPNDFIGIAEESGLIIALGEWVINEACRQIATWRNEFGFALPVAINISALHLRQHSLLQVVGEAIARFDIDPKLLEIEITEDSLDFRGEEDDSPYEILNRLSEMGISIAIDDFGTGYSSLSQLKKMPISTLKIDRSFVHDIAVNESDYAIITAIVGLAKTLDMQIVAEGVESEEQADQLRLLKCNVFQGFLYSRPLDAGDFMKRFLEQDSPAPKM